MPKVDVSVIIPCFNKEPYIDECINSVLDQSRQPKEIILLHDGCKEPMAHAKTTSIIYPENQGVAKMRAEGVRFSTGKLLLFLDGDDKISPDFIERAVLSINAGADIAYPHIFWWYQGKWGENRLGKTPGKLTPKLMHNLCRIPVTCLMKKDVYEDVGGFRNWEMFEDWDFWLRAMCDGYKFKRFDSLLWYRQYPNTRNRAEQDKKQKIYNQIKSQYVIRKGKLCPR